MDRPTTNHPIDERTAWRLVLAVSPPPSGDRVSASVGIAGDAPVPGADDAQVRLSVDASGRWEASAPVTRGARDIFELYLPLRMRAAWTLGQLGQSLDGRIATESGHSRYVTGPADIERLHRLRALADAVVVGAGTVAADDPRLTVREVEGPDPVRVILDPDGRLAADRAVFSDKAAPTIVVSRSDAGAHEPAASGASDAEAVLLPVSGPAGFDPHAVLHVLRERGLTRVLVEGGGITISRFLQAGALDRLHVAVAPVLIGSGTPALVLDPIDTMDEALRPACRHFHLGDDLLFDLELRGPAVRRAPGGRGDRGAPP